MLWIRDLVAAACALRRHPGFAGSAVLAIALGIGGVSAIFGLLQAVLWQPLPFEHSERIVAITRFGAAEASIGLPDAVAIRPELRSFAAVAAILPDWAVDRVDGGHPERLQGALVESAFFRALAVRPLIGRTLQDADDAVGAPPVVVLAEGYWRSEFAGDRKILGRRLQLSGVTASVVGVVTDAADVFEKGTQVWLPIAPFAPWAPESRGSNNFSAIGRLQAGVDLATADAELLTTSRRIAVAAGNPDKVLSATPWLSHLTADYRNGLWLLAAAVALVLLLATANVAALMVVRSARRERELGVRQALGAGGGHMLRQLLSEGLVLGTLGGLIGVLVAWVSFDLLRSLAGDTLPRLASASLSPLMLAIALPATLISVLVFSLFPAAQWRAPVLHTRSNGAFGSRSQGHALAWLVTLEVALATALLGSAALLAKSYLTLARAPLGISTVGVISGEVVLPEAGYARRERQSQAFTTMVDALAATPGVQHAGMIVGPPLTTGQSISHTLLIDGVDFADPEAASARFRPFVGDYFGAVGLKVLAGRAPTAYDEQAAVRSAWINRAFVERYLQGRDPIGARVAWKPGEASDSAEPQWMQVLGLVDDVRSSELRESDPPAVYAPYLQRDASWIRFGTLVARTDGATPVARSLLANAVAAGDPNIPLGETASMTERAERALAGDRFNLQMVASFALIALLLGLQGLFSVVAFAVEQRRGEIGLRMALGASPPSAVWTLMYDGLRRCLLGAVGGLALSVAAGQALSKMLFGVSAQDPWTLASAACIVLLAATIAILLPALRGLRVDPVVAMRSE